MQFPELPEPKFPSRLWAAIRRSIGRAIAYFAHAHTEQQRLGQAMEVWRARSPGDRLSPLELRRYMGDRIYGDADPAVDVSDSIQGLVIPFVDQILSDSAVRSVLNIGAYVGNVDYLLAKRHPGVQFTAADFWTDFIETNKRLALPNLRFVNGYALDMIERGEIHGDLTFFSSTATRIKNPELRRYLRALRSNYVLLNEPLFPLPDGRIPRPEDIDPQCSIPALLYPVYSGDQDGGYPPCLVHNYPAIVREQFRVIYAKIIDRDPPRFMLVGTRS